MIDFKDRELLVEGDEVIVTVDGDKAPHLASYHGGYYPRCKDVDTIFPDGRIERVSWDRISMLKDTFDKVAFRRGYQDKVVRVSYPGCEGMRGRVNRFSSDNRTLWIHTFGVSNYLEFPIEHVEVI